MTRKTKAKPKPARAKKNTKSKINKTAKGPARKTARSASPARKRHAPAKAHVIDTLVSANARALGIPLDPASRGGVTFNLGLILRFAALVDEFPLPDDIEPGPVFHA